MVMRRVIGLQLHSLTSFALRPVVDKYRGTRIGPTSNDSTDTCVADQRIKQLSITAAMNDLGTYRTCPKAKR